MPKIKKNKINKLSLFSEGDTLQLCVTDKPVALKFQEELVDQEKPQIAFVKY